MNSWISWNIFLYHTFHYIFTVFSGIYNMYNQQEAKHFLQLFLDIDANTYRKKVSNKG